MSLVICNEQDLQQANIRAAWRTADRLTADEFAQLCRVTVEQLQRDSRAEDRERQMTPAA